MLQVDVDEPGMLQSAPGSNRSLKVRAHAGAPDHCGTMQRSPGDPELVGQPMLDRLHKFATTIESPAAWRTASQRIATPAQVGCSPA